MDKVTIRRRVKILKSELSETERINAAHKVFEYVESLDEFVSAVNILIYHSLPDELPTHQCIEQWSRYKHLFLPRVNGNDLDILPYSAGQLANGAFNIAEPIGTNIVDPSIIDLIIVPGVAFDCNGCRIGRGKGFYDRLLSKLNAITVGVCYECQICNDIEPDDFDIPMDYVICNTGIIKRI